MANSKKKQEPVNLPGLEELLKTNEDFKAFQDLLGQNNLHNMMKRYKTVCSDRDKYLKQKDALVNALGTSEFSQAISRAVAWKKRMLVAPIAERYHLDTSFLDTSSPGWKVKLIIEDDNWEKKKIEWDKTKERWRKSALSIYNAWMEEVETVCKEESLGSEEITRYVEQAHEQFEETYLTRPYVELWKKFDTEINVSIELIENRQKVDFADCLAFTKDFIFQRLWKELSQQSSSLGEISKFQYDRFEATFSSAQREPTASGFPKLRELSKRITAGMIDRYVGGTSWPMPEDENRLFMLLSTINEDQRAEDWDIDDSTPLTKFVAFYQQLRGERVS
jgi:hypothetical protein